MVVRKPFRGEVPSDVRLRAGFDAEKQMAFYLKRAFSESEDVFVYNNLRFVRKGEVAQIDHLVLHRYGFVLIESKSVTGTVEVNRQLEFVRVYRRKRSGMKSPISQVEMQAELLQKLLTDHKNALRRKVMMGLIQGGFGECRFTRLVAVSDNGEIVRRQCNPPELMKADRVVEAIRDKIRKIDDTQGFTGAFRRALADKRKAREMDEHDIWAFTGEELQSLHRFFRKHDQPVSVAVKKSPENSTSSKRTGLLRKKLSDSESRTNATGTSPRATARPPKLPHQEFNEKQQDPVNEKPPRLRDTIRKPTAQLDDESMSDHVCRHCAGSQLRILYGPYGYYFECRECDRNTKIAVQCDGCGKAARVSKRKREFSKKCKECGRTDPFFTNPS